MFGYWVTLYSYPKRRVVLARRRAGPPSVRLTGDLDDLINWSRRKPHEEPGVDIKVGGKAVFSPKSNAWGRRSIVKIAYFQPSSVPDYLNYMRREGKGQDGQKPELFTAKGRSFDTGTIKGEERYYRVILSPQNNGAMNEKLVCDTVAAWERQSGQQFQWAASIHYDTDHHHAHIIIRGIDAEGDPVKLNSDLVKEGFRAEASKILTQRLGYRTQKEVMQEREGQVTNERKTQIDTLMIARRDGNGEVTPMNQLEARRLEFLALNSERTGVERMPTKRSLLGVKFGTDSYKLPDDLEHRLVRWGMVNDRLATMFGALKDARVEGVTHSYILNKRWTLKDASVVAVGHNEASHKPFVVLEQNSRHYYWEGAAVGGYMQGDKVNFIKGTLERITGKQPSQTPGREQRDVGRGD